MSTLTLAASVPKSATAHDVPVASDELDALGEGLQRAADLQGFEGKVGQTMLLPGSANEPLRVLVGIGERASVAPSTLRKAAAAFVRAVSKQQAVATTLVAAAPEAHQAAALIAVTEGVGLASYRFRAHKSGPDKGLRKVSVVAKFKGARAAFNVGSATVDAVRLARDLGNEPGGSLTPAVFAARAKEAATAAGLKVTVWDEKRIAKEKFGGVQFVNQGSTHPPRFLMLQYTPKGKPTANLGLVGKGITFDSGGLSIKSGAGMMTMKIDMAGGAAVIAAMTLLPVLGGKAAVTAYVPMTDNMINGDASRPGDVFTARNGTTVEVLNTDAEGRLILADALSYAAEKKHDAIIDIATLTGSVSAALGPTHAGIMGTDQAVVDRLLAAASVTDEKVWQLPLPTEYRKQLDSNVADVKNIGAGPMGGALIAGLFLKEFTGGVPWAHIDVGMSAFTEAEDGIVTKGAVGNCVRLLAHTAATWA